MNLFQKERWKNTLLEALEIDIVEISENRVVATMPVNEKTRQPMGYLHGGASVALAETVASIGGYNLVDHKREYVVGLEINANHIRSKRDGTITAVGTPLHRGRTTQVWEVKIIDENGKLISVSRCTLAVLQLEK